MINLKPFIKRVCAYTIDSAIVLFITTLISLIPFINKYLEDYKETYIEYTEAYNEYAEYLTLLESSYEDEEITSEEYISITELQTYNKILNSKYDDTQITEEEYNEIITEINQEFDIVLDNYTYLLNKAGVSNSIITLICTLLYFGVFQYLLQGQTIGKRILKIQVVSATDKKLNVFNYLLRSLIVNDVLLNVVGITFLIFASKKIYTSANIVVEILISIVEALIVFLVISREDGRGLHDLLFNTKVINVESPEETKSKSKKKIIDAEYKEEVKDNDKKPRKK